MPLNAKALPCGGEYHRRDIPDVIGILERASDSPQSHNPLGCSIARNNAARAALALRELIAENKKQAEAIRAWSTMNANQADTIARYQDDNRRLNALLEQLQQSAQNAAEDGDEEPTVVFQYAAEGFGAATIDGLTPEEASDLLLRLYEMAADVAEEE